MSDKVMQLPAGAQNTRSRPGHTEGKDMPVEQVAGLVLALSLALGLWGLASMLGLIATSGMGQ